MIKLSDLLAKAPPPAGRVATPPPAPPVTPKSQARSDGPPFDRPWRDPAVSFNGYVFPYLDEVAPATFAKLQAMKPLADWRSDADRVLTAKGWTHAGRVWVRLPEKVVVESLHADERAALPRDRVVLAEAVPLSGWGVWSQSLATRLARTNDWRVRARHLPGHDQRDVRMPHFEKLQVQVDGQPHVLTGFTLRVVPGRADLDARTGLDFRERTMVMTRFDLRKETGATRLRAAAEKDDAVLLATIGDILGISGGSYLGIGREEHKGGQNPWIEVTAPGGKPQRLQGKRLVQVIRVLLGQKA